jgi:hypothetical protein
MNSDRHDLAANLKRRKPTTCLIRKSVQSNIANANALTGGRRASAAEVAFGCKFAALCPCTFTA